MCSLVTFILMIPDEPGMLIGISTVPTMLALPPTPPVLLLAGPVNPLGLLTYRRQEVFVQSLQCRLTDERHLRSRVD